LKALASEDQRVKIVSLSGNFGHQAALTAGLKYANGDALVTLDADLQDPPEIVEEMLKRFTEGFEIIYGVRKLRNKDTAFKKFTAQLFYKLMKLMGVSLIYNHADFRLVSKEVALAFQKYSEANLFLRGIFPTMGFSQCVVEYERENRFAGNTKYPLRRMVAFAIEGITSFSYLPLRLIAIFGLLIFVISCALVVWALLTKAFGRAIPGWTSTVLPIYAFGGFQLMCIGIAGEYIGKIYMEVKRRPTYIVKETINYSNSSEKLDLSTKYESSSSNIDRSLFEK
jgi:glycosyltransferase involved in cell wall biosynthesis